LKKNIAMHQRYWI